MNSEAAYLTRHGTLRGWNEITRTFGAIPRRERRRNDQVNEVQPLRVARVIHSPGSLWGQADPRSSQRQRSAGDRTLGAAAGWCRRTAGRRQALDECRDQLVIHRPASHVRGGSPAPGCSRHTGMSDALSLQPRKNGGVVRVPACETRASCSRGAALSRTRAFHRGGACSFGRCSTKSPPKR